MTRRLGPGHLQGHSLPGGPLTRPLFCRVEKCSSSAVSAAVQREQVRRSTTRRPEAGALQDRSPIPDTGTQPPSCLPEKFLSLAASLKEWWQAPRFMIQPPKRGVPVVLSGCHAKVTRRPSCLPEKCSRQVVGPTNGVLRSTIRKQEHGA